jgi:hypothetical protein
MKEILQDVHFPSAEQPSPALAPVMGTGEASDEKPARSRSSLWKNYQDKIQSSLDAFQAARQAVLEWAADEFLPHDWAPVMRSASRGEESSRALAFTYTLGDPPPVYPLSMPASGTGQARYQSLIMLQPQQKNILSLYENSPIGSVLQIAPEFEEDDLGINELCLILSPEPLPISEAEIELSPDRLIEILDQARNKGSIVVTIGVKVIRKELTLARFVSELKERLIVSMSQAWQPPWAGEIVTASSISAQSWPFRMEEGEVKLTCIWSARSKNRPAFLDLSWRANLSIAAELWALFIDPETETVLSEVRLGKRFEGSEAFNADDLGFDPSTERWAVSILLKEGK